MLSDFKKEKGIELWADILEPSVEILGDEELKKAVGDNASRLEIIKLILKKHSKAILEIMARLNGEDPETYNPNVFELPSMLIGIMNDKEFIDFFQSQAQLMGVKSFGSATENTEAAVDTSSNTPKRKSSKT